MKDLIIVGAGGHGRVVADIAEKSGFYQSINFLDDGEAKTSMNFAIIGKTSDFEKYIKLADIFVAIGNSKIRSEFIERLLLRGASIPTIIHPRAVIGASVEIGVGTAVMAGVVVNPCVKIGKGVILNTCSSVDHDSVVGDYCHIAVGAHLAGEVKIEEHVWVGAGAIIKNSISICGHCMIGAGAVVVKEIVKKGIYTGVPAKIKE